MYKRIIYHRYFQLIMILSSMFISGKALIAQDKCTGALIDQTCFSYCSQGVLSDADHDGWGEENNVKCVVRNSLLDPLDNCQKRPSSALPADIGYAFHTYTKINLECQYTTDSSTDLRLITELPLIKNACKRHYERLHPDSMKLKDEFKGDRRAIADMIQCGKFIFFYGGYEVADLSIGMPEGLVDVVLEGMKSRVGHKLSKLGFLDDPWSEKFPLGISPSPLEQPEPDELEGRDLVLSCAACHVGTTASGFKHVGMANESVDIGAFNKLLYFALYRADQNKENGRWPEKVRAEYEAINQEIGLDPELECDPLIDDLDEYYACLEEKEPHDKRPKMIKALDIVYLNGNTEDFLKEQGITLPSHNELLSFASNTPGVYNPVYPSMTITDRQVLWSAGPIWRMRYYNDEHATKQNLGSILRFKTLEDFVQAANFATFSNTKAFSPKFSDPIVSYIRSLEAPSSTYKSDAQLAASGKELFEANCLSCHDGVDGETTNRYPLDEIGAPATYQDIFLDYKSPNEKVLDRFKELDSRFKLDQPSRDINSRKLKGIGERKLFMLNGALKGLDEVFCTKNPRQGPMDRNHPSSQSSHIDLCTNYTLEQKQALMEFLKSW